MIILYDLLLLFVVIVMIYNPFCKFLNDIISSGVIFCFVINFHDISYRVINVIQSSYLHSLMQLLFPK